MREVLVTGGSGQVGTELRRQGGFRWVAPSRAELNLADADALAAAVASRSWAAVVSLGAYTAVDRAETDVADAWRVNALAPAALAAAARAADIPIVHVSTDYVFDGAKPRPYVEEDAVAPLGVYGASKQGGEQAVRTGNPRHLILRTAWVVSPHGTNFVKTMLRLGRDRDEVRVVADQRGCPTAAGDIAAALATLTARMADDPAAPGGTYHFVNGGEASWADLAEAVFARAGLATRVARIGTADYPTPARRPANSRLATDKLARDHGITPRPWREAVDEVVDALAEGGGR